MDIQKPTSSALQAALFAALLTTPLAWAQTDSTSCPKEDPLDALVQQAKLKTRQKENRFKTPAELETYIACNLCRNAKPKPGDACLKNYAEAKPHLAKAAKSFFSNSKQAEERGLVALTCLMMKESNFDPRARVEDKDYKDAASGDNRLNKPIGAGQIGLATLETLKRIATTPSKFKLTEETSKPEVKEAFRGYGAILKDYFAKRVPVAQKPLSSDEAKLMALKKRIEALQKESVSAEVVRSTIDKMGGEISGGLAALSNLKLVPSGDQTPDSKALLSLRGTLEDQRANQPLSSNWSYYFDHKPPKEPDRLDIEHAVGLTAMYMKNIWNYLLPPSLSRVTTSEFLIPYISITAAYNVGPAGLLKMCKDPKTGAFNLLTTDCLERGSMNLSYEDGQKIYPEIFKQMRDSASSKAEGINDFNLWFGEKLAEVRMHMEGIANCMAAGVNDGIHSVEFDARTGAYKNSRGKGCPE